MQPKHWTAFIFLGGPTDTDARANTIASTRRSTAISHLSSAAVGSSDGTELSVGSRHGVRRDEQEGLSMSTGER